MLNVPDFRHGRPDGDGVAPGMDDAPRGAAWCGSPALPRLEGIAGHGRIGT